MPAYPRSDLKMKTSTIGCMSTSLFLALAPDGLSHGVFSISSLVFKTKEPK
jgi:hypothetical protein